MERLQPDKVSLTSMTNSFKFIVGVYILCLVRVSRMVLFLGFEKQKGKFSQEFSVKHELSM